MHLLDTDCNKRLIIVLGGFILVINNDWIKRIKNNEKKRFQPFYNNLIKDETYETIGVKSKGEK